MVTSSPRLWWLWTKTQVRTKQVSDFLVQGVIDMMDRLHLRATTLMSDNEPTILKLKATIRDAREHPTILQESHERDSKSNGFIESSIRWWQVKARPIRCSVESLYGRRLRSDHCILPWLVRWSALLVDRYRIRLDGQTSYQACFGARYAGEILPFSETVLFKMPASGRVGVGNVKIGKADSGFQHGIWVGKHERSDDHVILTGQGWFRCRTVRRLDETKRASQELFDAVRGLPWERQGQPGAQGGERLAGGQADKQASTSGPAGRQPSAAGAAAQTFPASAAVPSEEGTGASSSSCPTRPRAQPDGDASHPRANVLAGDAETTGVPGKGQRSPLASTTSTSATAVAVLPTASSMAATGVPKVAVMPAAAPATSKVLRSAFERWKSCANSEPSAPPVMMIGPSAPNGPPVPMEIAEESGFSRATLGFILLRPIRMASMASGMPWPRIFSDP